MNRQDFERLVEMTLADGQLSEQEQKVLIQRANELGITPDELQVIIEAKYQEKVQHDRREEEQARMQAAALAASAPTPSQATSPTPQKSGTQKASVRKCPECGAVLGTFTNKCPECGATFTGTGEAKGTGIEKFADMLSGSVSLEERLNVIKYSVIPTEKVELINYLTFCYTQITETFQGTFQDLENRLKVRKAWKQKLDEAFLKGDLLFKDDREAQNVVENIRRPFNEKIAELESNRKLFLTLRYGLLALALLFFIIGGAINVEAVSMIGFVAIVAFFIISKKRFITFKQL